MKIRTGVIFIGILFFGAAMETHAQTPLPLDQEIQGSLPLYGEVESYLIHAEGGTLLEVTLDMETRDFPLAMYLVSTEGTGQYIASNEGMNYPDFAGTYLCAAIPTTGDYKLTFQADGLEQRIDYTLYARQLDGDETNGTVLRSGDAFDGVIGPEEDYDIFTVALHKGNPVLFVASTPKSILDSVILLVDPSGKLVTYNDNFYGTGSTLLYTPQTTGNFQVILEGYYLDSMGPYTLLVNDVPLQSTPFLITDQIDIAGNMHAYQLQLDPSQVYDITAYAVDEFYPLIALTDANMNVIASDMADSTIPAAMIQGFTPFSDETLYLFVMGDTINATGDFGVSVEYHTDETDGASLAHGDAVQGVIGPIGDVDEYTFTAEADMDYSILVTPVILYLDPAVTVRDANGNRLFFNDDSADGIFSLLSGIHLPSPGEYTIQVSASPNQPYSQRLTGNYIIQFATGTSFDWGTPHILPEKFIISSTAAGTHIHIPTDAIADDTFPLSATMALDKTGRTEQFLLQKDQPIDLDLQTVSDEIFFLTLTDSSDKQNSTGPVTIPSPRQIAVLQDMPAALAVDHDNNIFVTDTLRGDIVKYAINGATETILSGIQTQGGTLGPNSLAFDSSGTLFFANASDNTIAKVLPGGATETVVDDLHFPIALIFDQLDTLYIAQLQGYLGTDQVVSYTPKGKQNLLTSGIRNPNGLAFSPDGELFLCNSSVGESGIYRIAADRTLEKFVTPFADSLQGLAFDRDGYVYTTNPATGELYRFSPDGKERITLATGIGAMADLEFGYGDYSKYLFIVSNDSYSTSTMDTPQQYAQQIIAVPTGREGIPTPYSPVTIRNWDLW